MSTDSAGTDNRKLTISVPQAIREDVVSAVKRSGISFRSPPVETGDTFPSCGCRIYFTPAWTASYPLLSYVPFAGSRLNEIRVEVESDLNFTSFTLLPAVATALREAKLVEALWTVSDGRVETYDRLVEESAQRLRNDRLAQQFVNPTGLTRDASQDAQDCSGCIEWKGEMIADVLVSQLYGSQHLDHFTCDTSRYNERTLPGPGGNEVYQSLLPSFDSDWRKQPHTSPWS
jgi:hypothetical protein